MMKNNIIFYQRLENDKLRKELRAYEKKDKTKQLRKLAKRIEVKIEKKVNAIREKLNQQEKKFGNYILEKFETHILQMPK